MTSAPAIGFDYRPSGLSVWLLTVVAALALAAIGSCGASLGLKLAMMACTVVLAGFTGWRTHHPRVAGLGCGPDGWTVYHADRSPFPATLLSHRVLGTCVLLRLRTDDTTETLLLAPDNSDADIRRRLRMRLAAQTSIAESP